MNYALHARILSCMIGLSLFSSGTPIERMDIATIDIGDFSSVELDQLKSDDRLKWWAEFGDTLVVGGSATQLDSSQWFFASRWPNLSARDVRVVIAGHKNEFSERLQVVAHSGHTMLIVGQDHPPADEHMLIRELCPNHVYVQSAGHASAHSTWSDSDNVAAQSAMSEVDGNRWLADVTTLAGWNRYVAAPGNILARDWLKRQFESLHPSSVNLQKFSVGGREAWNVVATFDAGPGSDIYIVGGHFDSTSEQVSVAAPGAEDNATGAAGVLELARVFGGRERKATMILIAVSGEEEGLYGSKAFVRDMPSEMSQRVKSVITMDMIGYTKDGSLNVLLETSQEFDVLSGQLAEASKLVSGLKYFQSFDPFGSDHMPFINAHIPTMLTIDNDWGDYPSYHRTSDKIENVTGTMGTAILKMNAAALAVLSGRP